MSSYIIMPSKKLRSICNQKLQRIAHQRELDVKNYLQLTLETLNSVWWRRLLKRFLTPQEVEEREAQQIQDIRQWRYLRSEQVARKLLGMCDVALTVRVGMEDYDRVS